VYSAIINSVICMRPWTTALHLARPTPLHTHELTPEAAASLPAETDDWDADESASLPVKHAKTDSWSASLKFLVTAAVTSVPAADSDFDQYLVVPAPSIIR